MKHGRCSAEQGFYRTELEHWDTNQEFAARSQRIATQRKSIAPQCMARATWWLNIAGRTQSDAAKYQNAATHSKVAWKQSNTTALNVSLAIQSKTVAAPSEKMAAHRALKPRKHPKNLSNNLKMWLATKLLAKATTR